MTDAGLRAEVLAIGDEIVHGQIADTNSGYIAGLLEPLGVDVQRFTTVSDDPDELESAIREACARSKLVIATGGLGPTEDDRTRDAAAACAGDELVFDQHVWDGIAERFKRVSRRLSASNRRQAERPASARVLENDWGTAPGFAVRIGDCEFFAFPGVPRELKPMLDQHLLPWVHEHSGQRAMAFARLQLIGPSESVLGEKLADLMHEHRNPRVGITASGGVLSVRIAAVGDSHDQAEAMCEETAELVRPIVRKWLVCEGAANLPEQCGARLLEHGVTMATAESCTGGMVGSLLTDLPGISASYLGGYVTYTGAAKTRDLGVPSDVIESHGEVSEEVTRAMVEGLIERTGADLGISVSGVAGPSGGTEEKPVGLVCFGLYAFGEIRTWASRIPPIDRGFIRRRAAAEAFSAVIRALDARP